ncbi:MAG TPA: holo-ACP synthase [Fibrobacteria bacterium]|nr:holo-ACP synthase [Fibrobacteria bacterium]
MIVGLGIDSVLIERIRAVSTRLFERICTPAERQYCESFGEGRFERYAGRFAAKEAISKALGTGISQGINWTDLEILPSPSGAPVAVLHGPALERSRLLGATTVLVSITHDKSTAAAVCVLEGTPSSGMVA